MFDGRIEALITVPSGGAAMSVTTAAGGPTTVTIPAGDYYLTVTNSTSGLLDIMQTRLQADRPPGSGSWTVALDTGATGTLRTSITCADASWTIEWTSTTLRDLLGFSGDLSAVTGTQTSDNQTRGVWGPDCPMMLDGDAAMAPKVTDLRELVSPTGAAIGIVGTSRYVHTNLRYSHVPAARYREDSATYSYASWERFLDDVQFGDGHSWFSPLSRVQIYDHNGDAVGSDFNSQAGVSGWFMRGVTRIATSRGAGAEGINAYWRIEIPELTSDG